MSRKAAKPRLCKPGGKAQQRRRERGPVAACGTLALYPAGYVDLATMAAALACPKGASRHYDVAADRDGKALLAATAAAPPRDPSCPDAWADEGLRALHAAVQAAKERDGGRPLPPVLVDLRKALDAARDKNVRLNGRLGVGVQLRYGAPSGGVTRADLVQGAAQGLDRAAMDYDSRQAKYSTYAADWARQGVGEALSSRDLVDTPLWVLETRRKVEERLRHLGPFAARDLLLAVEAAADMSSIASTGDRDPGGVRSGARVQVGDHARLPVAVHALDSLPGALRVEAAGDDVMLVVAGEGVGESALSHAGGGAGCFKAGGHVGEVASGTGDLGLVLLDRRGGRRVADEGHANAGAALGADGRAGGEVRGRRGHGLYTTHASGSCQTSLYTFLTGLLVGAEVRENVPGTRPPRYVTRVLVRLQDVPALVADLAKAAARPTPKRATAPAHAEPEDPERARERVAAWVATRLELGKVSGSALLAALRHGAPVFVGVGSGQDAEDGDGATQGTDGAGGLERRAAVLAAPDEQEAREQEDEHRARWQAALVALATLRGESREAAEVVRRHHGLDSVAEGTQGAGGESFASIAATGLACAPGRTMCKETVRKLYLRGMEALRQSLAPHDGQDQPGVGPPPLTCRQKVQEQCPPTARAQHAQAGPVPW